MHTINTIIVWNPDRSRLKRPIYRSLAEQMEKDIAAGFLPPGTNLPPQRELADFLDINFTTVTRAYRLCELKGLIYAVTGSGTFVALGAAKSVTISAGTLTGGSIDLGFVSSFEQCNDMISDTIVSVIKKRRFAELLDYEYPTGMPHHKAARAEEMNALFYEFFPEQKGVGHPLSFYRWLPIRDTRRGAEVERELLDAGIRVYHSDRFLGGPREGQCYLRISLATAREKELLRKGLTILAEHI